MKDFDILYEYISKVGTDVGRLQHNLNPPVFIWKFINIKMREPTIYATQNIDGDRKIVFDLMGQKKFWNKFVSVGCVPAPSKSHQEWFELAKRSESTDWIKIIKS